MKKIVWGLFFSLILCGSTALAADSTSDVTVKAEVDRAFMTIGDQVNFKITVTHPAKTQVLDMDASDSLRDFDIKKVTNFSSEDAGMISEGKNFLITNYTLGDYVIRPIRVQYRSANGQSKEILTNQLFVSVETVNKTKDEANDIKGIKGVINLARSLVVWIILGLVLIIITGILSWRHFSKKQMDGAPAEPDLSPHDEAYKALNELEFSDLIKRGNVKIYFLKMSEILRHYFERRYKIRALEFTTWEVVSNLKPLVVPETLKAIRDVLEFCDLAKFAKYVPPALEIMDSNKRARAVIDITKEVAVETPAIPETEPVSRTQ